MQNRDEVFLSRNGYQEGATVPGEEGWFQLVMNSSLGGGGGWDKLAKICTGNKACALEVTYVS